MFEAATGTTYAEWWGVDDTSTFLWAKTWCPVGYTCNAEKMTVDPIASKLMYISVLSNYGNTGL